MKQRLSTFTSSLITEGKTSALIHGLLSFFKHVFADQSLNDEIKKDQDIFLQWRQIYQTMLLMCTDINKTCAALLSNNRLTDEGKELVDCRGHPVGEDETLGKDYENLVLVGIWLAVKENGEFMQNLIEWSELPQSADDQS